MRASSSSVHRLDRVTSGLLMIAKTADAAREVADVLRRREIDKYYVALSSRKPNKKQGRVSGDMARSRRGQGNCWRSTEQPAQTAFISKPLVFDAGGGGRRGSAVPTARFLLKPRSLARRISSASPSKPSRAPSLATQCMPRRTTRATRSARTSMQRRCVSLRAAPP